MIALSARTVVFPSVVFAIHFVIVQLVAMLAVRFGSSSRTYESVRARQGFVSTLEGAGPNRRAVHPVGQLLVQLLRQIGIPVRNTRSNGSLRQHSRYILATASLDDPEPVGAHGAFSRSHRLFPGQLLLCRRAHRPLSPDPARLQHRDCPASALVPGAFPTSFFFHAVYTEAPFLLLVVASLLAARKNQWLLAGIVALLAALMRSHGVLLILPMLVIFIEAIRRDRRRWLPGILFVFLPLIGPLVYGWKWHQAGYSLRSMTHLQQQQLDYGGAPWQSIPCAIRYLHLGHHRASILDSRRIARSELALVHAAYRASHPGNSSPRRGGGGRPR